VLTTHPFRDPGLSMNEAKSLLPFNPSHRISLCSYLQVPLFILVSKYSPQRPVLKYPQSKIILNFNKKAHTVFVNLKNRLW
jgi:hypothetical protein